MATVTRSIGVMPFQGGSFVTNVWTQSMVRLTSTRMVWTFLQTSPNWMVGAVVDTPGGWINNTGSPVITNQQLLKQVSPYLVQSVKINQTTYMVINQTFTANFTWDVYEVDVAGIISKVDTGTVNLNSSYQAAITQGTSSSKLIYLQDNLITYVAQGLQTNMNNLSSLKATYDATAKKLTWATSPVTLIATLPVTSCELIAKPIPGQPYTLVTARYYNSNWYEFRGSSSVTISNTTGNMQLDSTKLPTTYAANSNGYSEITPVSADRFVELAGPSAAHYQSIDWVTGSQVNLGSNPFTTTLAYDNFGRFILPLTADYFVTGTRIGTFIPTGSPIRLKVIRRVDQNFIEQSPASSLNSNAGFGVSAVPATYANNQSYPEMIEGKIFYWGTDATGLKLSWTAIGLDPPVQ